MNESTQKLVKRLSPHLFWDIDLEVFDAEANSMQLIQRVLEYGELEDWCVVRDYYGYDRIAADCKKMRSLRPEALSFVCLVTNTDIKEYRCYNITQSRPTPWNS